MTKLKDRFCKPSNARTALVLGEQLSNNLKELNHPWTINSVGHLEGVFTFQSFADAMNFANKLAQIAEAENHHPDLHIRWGQCRVEIWTHVIGGLSESDFILAAKSEAAYPII